MSLLHTSTCQQKIIKSNESGKALRSAECLNGWILSSQQLRFLQLMLDQPAPKFDIPVFPAE